MVAKTGKTSKAKSSPQKPAKPQAPAKKKPAPVAKPAAKPAKTKASVKSQDSSKAKKPVAKPVAKGEAPAAVSKSAKKAARPVVPAAALKDEVIIPVKPEEMLAVAAKAKKSAAPLVTPVKKGRAKTAELDENEADREFDGGEERGDDEGGKRARKDGGAKKGRSRKRSPTEEFLVEDMEEIVEEDEDAEPILDDLDPFSSTLLLDPDLIDAPIVSSTPVPPARTKRLAPRVQVCADCGQQFGWLSIERLCFNCLKKKVSQRKKDEDYSGYGTEEASGGEDY